MFTLFKEVGFKRCMTEELPYLTVAFLTAEFFYKFHSFSLECLAFLGTWGVLSGIGAFVLSSFRSPKPTSP